MIDVVICTYNRPHLVKEIVYTLMNQVCNLIIVDDGSTELMTFFDIPNLKKFSWTKHTTYQRVARFNEGISYVTADKMILLDGDTVPRSDHFIFGYNYLLDHFDVVRGPFHTTEGPKRPLWFSTANIGFRTEAMKKIGGFDPEYNGKYGYDDADLEHTIKKLELRVTDGSPETAAEHCGTPYAGDRSGSEINEVYYKRKWGFR